MEAQIRTRDELIAHIFRMLDDHQSVEWENGSARVFLETMAAWLHDTRPLPPSAGAAAGETVTWQLVADARAAGRG